MEVSSCDMCVSKQLASFHCKIREAIALVRGMSTEDKLKAVQYWNVVSENLQDVVNSSADDISALQSQLYERENMILLQTGRAQTAGAAAARGFTIIRRTESDVTALEPAHRQAGVTVIGPEVIDRFLISQPPVGAAPGGEQLTVPVIVGEYDVLCEEVLDDPLPEPVASSGLSSDSLDAEGPLEPERGEPAANVINALSVSGDVSAMERGDVAGDEASPGDVPNATSVPGIEETGPTQIAEHDIVNMQKCLSFTKNKAGAVVLNLFTKSPKSVSDGGDSHEYRCNVCQTLYPSVVAFYSHFAIYCDQLLCCKCGRTFPAKTQYRSHIVTHSKSLKCIECGRTFTKFGNLSRHMKTHTGERLHECTVCHKRFAERKDLHVHSRLHSGERPYQCTHCPARFIQLNALNAHLRGHDGERPHLCDICGKTFSLMTNLKDHKLRHEGKKRYPCDLCFLAFDVRSDLNRHRSVHRPEKPHKCTECSKSFPRAQALTEHLNRHFGMRPHQCRLCRKAYADRSALNKHMQTHDRDEPSEPRPESPPAGPPGAVLQITDA